MPFLAAAAQRGRVAGLVRSLAADLSAVIRRPESPIVPPLVLTGRPEWGRWTGVERQDSGGSVVNDDSNWPWAGMEDGNPEGEFEYRAESAELDEPERFEDEIDGSAPGEQDYRRRRWIRVSFSSSTEGGDAGHAVRKQSDDVFDGQAHEDEEAMDDVNAIKAGRRRLVYRDAMSRNPVSTLTPRPPTGGRGESSEFRASARGYRSAAFGKWHQKLRVQAQKSSPRQSYPCSAAATGTADPKAHPSRSESTPCVTEAKDKVCQLCCAFHGVSCFSPCFRWSPRLRRPSR